MLKVKTQFDGKYDCIIKAHHDGKKLVLQMYDYYEPFATLTTSLEAFGKEYAYVDVNNCPWAEEMIARYKLGVPTGIYQNSGYCSYPLYKFDLKELEKHAEFPKDYVAPPCNLGEKFC